MISTKVYQQIVQEAKQEKPNGKSHAHNPPLWKFWAVIGIIILYFIALVSCSPEKQAIRYLKEHPGFVHIDTIKIRDTIKIPGAKADTAFRFIKTTDTVVFNNKQLQVKYYYHNDTVFIKGECKPVTIYKDRVVTVNTYNPTLKDGVSGWWRVGFWILSPFALFGIGYLVYRLK